MDEQAVLAQQKEQCIFCKIVKGDVPAKKVFEDDKVLAIMDINPAKKGHVLVLPKEHYPILPLIPFPEMQHLFKQTHGVARAVKQAMLCQGISVFIANGAAAGQQNPHFILHVIPREKDDFFTGVALPTTGDKVANDALAIPLQQRLSALMQAYLTQTGRQSLTIVSEQPVMQEEEIPEPTPVPTTQASDEQLDKLIAVINENNDLKDALLYRVEEVKEAVKTSEKWEELFKGVDIDKLSQNLQAMVAAQVKRQENNGEGS